MYVRNSFIIEKQTCYMQLKNFLSYSKKTLFFDRLKSLTAHQNDRNVAILTTKQLFIL